MPDDSDGIRQDSYSRVTTTETVKRGDLYVPLADRFDKLERRVAFLSWAVVIDIILTLTSNAGFVPELVKWAAKLSGN